LIRSPSKLTTKKPAVKFSPKFMDMIILVKAKLYVTGLVLDLI
jgi:hypothetical protein